MRNGADPQHHFTHGLQIRMGLADCYPCFVHSVSDAVSNGSHLVCGKLLLNGLDRGASWQKRRKPFEKVLKVLLGCFQLLCWINHTCVLQQWIPQWQFFHQVCTCGLKIPPHIGIEFLDSLRPQAVLPGTYNTSLEQPATVWHGVSLMNINTGDV